MSFEKCFPNIKVGGYSSCGFYAITGAKTSDFYKGFITWAEEFTTMCAKENIPLDFYSWHRYFDDPEILTIESEYVRNLLDKNGLTATESIFNEWNYCCDKNGCTWDIMKEAEGASNIAHAMILLQHLSVDKAMYYVANPQGAYCGMYYYPSQKVTPTYYVFKAFNRLYSLRNELAVDIENSSIAVLGAANDNNGAIMLANSKSEAVKVFFDFKNIPGEISAKIIDSQHTFEKIEFTENFEMPPYSVLLLETNAESQNKTLNDVCGYTFAGLDND